MFYRSDNTVETVESTGLGMYIAKESVAKLNGEISLTSTLHVGTIFKIVLPKIRVLSVMP